MVPTAEARMTRQILYSALPSVVVTAWVAIVSPELLVNQSGAKVEEQLVELQTNVPGTQQDGILAGISGGIAGRSDESLPLIAYKLTVHIWAGKRCQELRLGKKLAF